MSAQTASFSVDRDVRLAARALARHALVHAYGHVSGRIDGARFVVTPAHPLMRIALTTRLVICAIDGPLPEGALPEVRMHQAIYRSRSEVFGICRFQSPSVVALSALRRTPRALHGLGAYFAPHPPLWDDPLLVRDHDRAHAVAEALADARAIVLRGNGAITVGTSPREAACHAFFLEDAARIELSVLATGSEGTPYTLEESKRRGSGDRQLYDRMWDYLLGDDAASILTEEMQS